MYLSKIILNNFRSYSNLELNVIPQTGINIFLAPNGKGKTNLLEAISLLSFPKSFRNLKFNDLVNFDSYYFSIKAELTSNETYQDFQEVFFDQEKNMNMQVTYDHKQNQKAFFINQLKVPSKDFMGNFHAIVFNPDDLHLFVLGPQTRRRFLNTYLSTIYKDYFEAMLKYNQILKSRNKMLKDGSINQVLFNMINQNLATYGSIIYKYRMDFISYINQNLKDTYFSLAPDSQDNEIQIKYLGFTPSEVNEYRNEYHMNLIDNFEKDLRYKSTNNGVHRDDFQIFYDNKPIQSFYSRGENRTFVLALKLLQVKYLEQFITYKPVLLLDDVFSELDEQRRNKLLEFSSSYQTFITTVEKAYFDNFSEKFSLFKITENQISKLK